MNQSTVPGLKAHEVSYLLEAQILGVDPIRLTAVRFGQQDASYLRPPEPLSRYHNPLGGPDFCMSELQIGSRG